MKIVISLGGNALKGTVKEQMMIAQKMTRKLKKIIEENQVIITHGNGPQVGELLIKYQDEIPLYVLVAMTQAQIGFFIQNAISKTTNKKSVVVITNCTVAKNDPGFKNPTKPVGPFYKTKKKGMIEDAGRGYRLVVPSPKVKKVIEIDAIKKLLNSKNIVIAGGGGGIPISKKGEGIDAVIDKDDTSQIIASQVNAEVIIFVTAVDNLYWNFGKTNQKKIDKIKVAELKKHLDQFAQGSMRPKIQAAIKFIENGGKKVIITSVKNVTKVLKEKRGTIISQ